MSPSRVPEVSRTQVLAHRVAAQQLDRAGPDAATDLAIVDLGVQDTPSGAAAQAMLARLPSGAEVDTADGRRWSTVWGVRGAPHVHRRGDLRALAAALWPASADDAAVRLAATGTYLRKNGVDPLEAIAVTAAAYGDVVTDEMPKGEASTALTARVPDEAISWCRSCQAHHLSDQLMRLAALPGGARLVPGGKATLAPVPRWPGVPDGQVGLRALILTYLSLHGPAGRPEVAAYLGTTQRNIADAWPDDALEPVTIDGAEAWVPASTFDALMAAETATLTRLLPRSDPWLLARDRDRTVPEKADQKALWPMLGQPGGLLVDGEVLGAWRTKTTSKRLDITISTFGPVPKRARSEVDAEASLVAASRRVDGWRVTWD